MERSMTNFSFPYFASSKDFRVRATFQAMRELELEGKKLLYDYITFCSDLWIKSS